jgi:putative ABC transport system permease protein
VVKETFSKLPFITDLSLTSHSPGSGWSRSGAENEEGEEIYINTMRVDADFVNTFQIALLQGRNGTEEDINKSVIITETTLKQLGWDDFEGRKLWDYDVIGIVNEFQYNSMHSLIGPVAFMYSDRYYSALNVRLLPDNFGEQLSQMKKAWKQAGIEQPFQFQFYNDYYNKLYKKEELEAKALSLFSIVAFIITCLGLLAQIIQVTERRVKEIGIRKINGATVGEVMQLLNREFVIAVVVSFVIAAPLAYYLMQQWLTGFAYKTALSWWVFALAGLAALVITLVTVSWQSWRAATRNPVEALRYE